MKKSTILLVMVFLSITVHSQTPVKKLWTKTVGEGVRWQKVTSLGNYVVGTGQGIMGLDPDKGEPIWTNTKFGPVPADKVQQVGSSPLISVNLGSEVYMLDPYSGEIRFDSKSAGINEIRDQQVLYQSNGILVSGRNAQGKDVLLMSSLADGRMVWKIEEDFGRFVTASEQSPEELLIVTFFYNYKINPKTGKVIWKNDISGANKQLEKMGALGALMKQAAANAAQNVDLNVQFYKHPTQPIFYVASEQEGQAATTGFTTSTSSGGPSYHTNYSAFNLSDGSPVWNQPLDISGKMGPIYFDEKGIAVLPDDGMNTKVNLYDYKTKEGMWGKKGKGVKVKGGIYSYLKVKDGLILVSANTSGKNYISFLSLSTLELTFDKPVKVDGTMVYSEITPKGLLYATTEEINILDVTSGSLLFDKAIRTSPSLMAQKGNTLYVFDSKDNVLKSLDKNTGTMNVISAPIKFDGKEAPTGIELRDKGILVSSSQNLALFGFDGKVIYQKYFEAPREPGIIRALQYAQAVRAAYIGASAYTASAAFHSAGQQVKSQDEVSGVVLEGVGKAYNELGNAASDFAKKSFQQANARFKATKEADHYTVILTKKEKDNVLMKVDKDTGEIGGIISLGKDTSPDYVMDGVTGTVFYSTGGNSITAYQF